MDLLTLQGCIKRDPDGYLDEFRQQYRHYKACLEIFRLQPTKESHEFSSLVGFVAQVAPCYPHEVQGFAAEVGGLLEEQATALDSSTRLALVRALILMRNRGVLSALDILPTLFRLFRCQDKALRQLLFRHIIADIKSANRKHRDNKLNRGVQAFLYGLLQQEEESAALRALAVLTELHRRNVWRDARTVNVIASATQHPSSRVMLAAIKFFLGQDEAEDAGSDDDEDGGGSRKQESGAATPPAAPSSKEVYAAKSKGTNSSKKKKAAKVKRAMQAVKKAERRQAGSVSESFAAMQLLHDPQTFAERLFARLQKANERLETRLAMMAVISRAVGVHQLLLLNFYPFLQKYIQPHQRDVTQILAILIQAVHELVPPDVLAPVLKQLADQFINDRTRPEVMVVGMRAVRELAQRAPLLMTPDLLQDLAEYRKYKHKEVSSAARALVSLFRQINPSLLAKKDRGRNADLGKAPLEYGASAIPDRIEGAELLQAAELAGSGDSDASSDSELELGSDAEEGEEAGADSDAEAAAANGSIDSAAEGNSPGESSDDEDGSGWESASDEEAAVAAVDAVAQAAGSSDDGGGSDAAPGSSDASGSVLELEGSDAADASGGSDSDVHSDGDDPDSGEQGDDAAEASDDEEAQQPAAARKRAPKRRAPSGLPDSLKTLKKQLTEAKATAAAKQGASDPGEQPLEWGRILTGEDFERIRELRHKKLVDDTLARHGIKTKAVNAQRMERLREAAEGEAEELLDAQDVAKSISEQRVRSDELASKHKGRRDKAERMASVLAGREGREFGAAAGRKKNKSGGLSNRQKQKVKNMPAAARAVQLKRRAGGKPRGKAAKKAQRGHTGASNFGRAKGGRKKK